MSENDIWEPFYSLDKAAEIIGVTPENLISAAIAGYPLLYVHKFFKTLTSLDEKGDRIFKDLKVGWFQIPSDYIGSFLSDDVVRCDLFFNEEDDILWGSVDIDNNDEITNINAEKINKKELFISGEHCRALKNSSLSDAVNFMRDNLGAIRREARKPKEKKRSGIDPEKSSLATIAVLVQIIQRISSIKGQPNLATAEGIRGFIDEMKITGLSDGNLKEKFSKGNKEIKPFLPEIKKYITEILP